MSAAGSSSHGSQKRLTTRVTAKPESRRNCSDGVSRIAAQSPSKQSAKSASRSVVVVGLPVLGAVVLAGALVAALQTATSIHDPAISYGARLVSLVLVLYMVFPSAARAMLELAELAFR